MEREATAFDCDDHDDDAVKFTASPSGSYITSLGEIGLNRRRLIRRHATSTKRYIIYLRIPNQSLRLCLTYKVVFWNTKFFFKMLNCMRFLPTSLYYFSICELQTMLNIQYVCIISMCPFLTFCFSLIYFATKNSNLL